MRYEIILVKPWRINIWLRIRGIVLFSLLMVWTELITVARSVKIFATIYFTKEQYISTFVYFKQYIFSVSSLTLSALWYLYSAQLGLSLYYFYNCSHKLSQQKEKFHPIQALMWMWHRQHDAALQLLLNWIISSMFSLNKSSLFLTQVGVYLSANPFVL